MVANHVTLQPRMAIRETAKVFGVPGGEISRISKKLPWIWRAGAAEGGYLEQMQDLPQLRGVDFSGPWAEILRLAAGISGVPRHLSVHPGGVVITPDPVTDYVPVQRAAKGVPIIQWEKDGAEAAGLVKIDLLGNRSLGVIRDAVRQVKAGGHILEEQGWLPEDDPATRAAVAKGQTMGCFYIESPATRLLQQRARQGDFGHLVIHSSIIRPAANEFIREYLRRLHGGQWQPLHPLVAGVLDETYGIMVYQEDVSRVAVQFGFSHADADRLRKIMSKKDKQRQLKDYQTQFFAAAAERGVSDEIAGRIWAMMMSFDGYSFCKPHSASYARVSFQAAYLKPFIRPSHGCGHFQSGRILFDLCLRLRGPANGRDHSAAGRQPKRGPLAGQRAGEPAGNPGGSGGRGRNGKRRPDADCGTAQAAALCNSV